MVGKTIYLLIIAAHSNDQNDGSECIKLELTGYSRATVFTDKKLYPDYFNYCNGNL
ncbi:MULTISPECIES: hypothetical protein [Acinetobacter]|uniref:Uncharacterized protein n=1 Tax=Acinetobacter corruptisaponis TaxID=3045147 RepID=A0ABY8S986_9GAMM|nr:hypothetical protein [Acinetobacter sp. KCTC 92772]WHP07072.1 hypothetical protein QLH32_06310 [Acinetobacter sp. KCTC 92772]